MKNRLRWLFRAVTLFAIGGLATAHAANTDWTVVVFNSVNTLIDQDAAAFVHIGLVAATAACFIKLMWGLAMSMLQQAGHLGGHHVYFDIEFLFRALFHLAVLTAVLNCWANPIGGTNFSLHQIPMALSDGLISQLVQTQANQFMTYVQQTATKLQHPNPLALLDVAVYIIILIQMGAMALVMFLLTAFGYIGEAIFVVITPLLLWCTFFQVTFSWAWNCIQNMLSFAAYKLVGGIVIYVLSDVLINFFVNGVGPDYSIAHWIVLLPVVILFTGLFVFALFLVPLICASIFNGAGAIGQAVSVAAGRIL